MRQIKFRAWDGKEYVDLNLINAWFVEFGDGAVWQNTDEHGQGVDFLTDRDDVILEQFTGLADRNGKDIYEGDIISLDGDPYTVEWEDEGYFGFQDYPNPIGRAAQCDKDGWSYFEVIGHIHEDKP